MMTFKDQSYAVNECKSTKNTMACLSHGNKKPIEDEGYGTKVLAKQKSLSFSPFFGC